ncbi:hypothetical protein GIB67_020041 [Kingdonia uniflora]|uniref:Aminotransferase-like plant mobile domain-containing protein n=1 Tax=Kingdonia uniflora TaxID=39325 RepID=A0A7J7N4B6_9MAGN|nr:hypothetical protein GIB67_020041 [Kingdonia uniflora]
MPPKGRGKLPTTRGRKIVPTASLRKRLNEERDDPSHPNYNNPPRVSAKRRKTRSTRVPLRDSLISGSLPRVLVTPEEEFSSTSDSQGESTEDFLGEDAGCLRVYHHSPSWELGKEIERVQNIVNVWGRARIGAICYKHYNSALITAFAERWHLETNSFYFKWGEMTITLEDVSRLIGPRVDGDLTVVKGAWGALAVKEIWKKCMYLPDSVYPNLKAGGQGISFSLKKIVEFFVGKVGTNVHDNASTSSIRLSSRMVGKAYMLYVLGSFMFPTKKGTDVSVKYLSFFQDQHVSKPWSWEATALAHLYYSLGASSRVNAKGIACYTTLLELPGIPTRNESDAPEFCTRWCGSKTTSAQTGSVALEIFSETLDSYKVDDVIFDPYVEKREDKHMLEEVASFTVSFTKLCPNVVNLGEDADYDGARVLGASSGVSQRENNEVPQNQNEGGRGPGEVNFGAGIGSEGVHSNTLSSIHILRSELPLNNFVTRLLLLQTSECAFFMEATGRMQADIEVKNLANSICEKKLNEKLNIVPHPEENVGEAEMWKQKYEELHAKFEEAQRRLSEIDKNDKVIHDRWHTKYIHETKKLGVWRLILKGAIEGGDFEDLEDLTYVELGRQFTKLLTIAQEGPKGEYEDDIILSGRGEYQEIINSRLKKIDHKTNLRQSLFQPFNWFQLDIRDVESDGNTAFRVIGSYAYQSQMKFSNVKVSLCTLMTKKPSY